ncbi:MAG: cupin domain-containing protein, partial [Thermaurantiacus sp.]
DRIQWGKFAVYHGHSGDLDDQPDLTFPFVEGSRFRAANTGIDEPALQVNIEDFYKGVEIPWTLSHDEAHYVISGECEVEYHLPPLMLDSGKVIVVAGATYYMPRGCRVVWRVLSDEPFRHLCFCFPNPGYPIPVARSNQG